MACCGSKKTPGGSQNTAIVLGEGGVSGSTVYARVLAPGVGLATGLGVHEYRYFTGSGVVEALNSGMLQDASASAIRNRRRPVVEHEFMVVSPGGERERYGVWKEAQKRARVTGGRIEVVPVEAGGE